MRRAWQPIAVLMAFGTIAWAGVASKHDPAPERPTWDRAAAASEKVAAEQTGLLKQFIDTKLWNDTVLWNNVARWNYVVAANYAAAIQRAQAEEAARAVSARRVTRSIPSRTAPSGGGGGGCNPAGIIQAESRGDITARNASGAAGKYQFMPGTWAGYGGYSSADQAPEAVQDAKFNEVWAGGAGASHWAASVC